MSSAVRAAPVSNPAKTPLTQAEFAAEADVSRETADRLGVYLELLRRWQSKINLVSEASLKDAWRRHFLDSAQLYRLIDGPGGRLYDVGSGAGFPGLVLAIMGFSDVHLVESDHRKSVFLREAARITGARIEIHTLRAEKLSPKDADFVTARGCAALPELLDLATPLLKPSGICFFLKGHGVEAELTAANKAWTMQIQRFPSKSDATGTILRLEEIHRVGGIAI